MPRGEPRPSNHKRGPVGHGVAGHLCGREHAYAKHFRVTESSRRYAGWAYLHRHGSEARIQIRGGGSGRIRERWFLGSKLALASDDGSPTAIEEARGQTTSASSMDRRVSRVWYPWRGSSVLDALAREACIVTAHHDCRFARAKPYRRFRPRIYQRRVDGKHHRPAWPDESGALRRNCAHVRDDLQALRENYQPNWQRAARAICD